MAEGSKEDYLNVDQAAESLGISRASLYNYMNVLNIQRSRFRFDRRTYVSKADVERIRRFMEEHRE